MKFILRINMDNAAFNDGNEGAELARILRSIVEAIEGHGAAPQCFQNVRDINGNIVGQYAAKPDDYSAA